MTDFENELINRDEIIKSLQRQNKLKDNMLNNMESIAKGQDKAIESLMEQVNIKDEMIAFQEKRIDELNDLMAKLEALIKQMLSSDLT